MFWDLALVKWASVGGRIAVEKQPAYKQSKELRWILSAIKKAIKAGKFGQIECWRGENAGGTGIDQGLKWSIFILCYNLLSGF